MPSLFNLILSVCLLAVTLLYLFHSHAVRFQPDSRHSLDSRPRDARTLSANATISRPKWSEDIDIVCYDEERLERHAYGSGPGAVVRGYPAKGGLYVLQKASSVEVEFLGFDRFDTEASSDADTEEALCDNSVYFVWPAKFAYLPTLHPFRYELACEADKQIHVVLDFLVRRVRVGTLFMHDAGPAADVPPREDVAAESQRLAVAKAENKMDRARATPRFRSWKTPQAMPRAPLRTGGPFN
ncbi:hypothetical protein SBRCBS47491_009196 [Sporothrix bragantina]|uniref:Uncharacterized protein n=1 Tax=Sporothrix bragantina TaxID=671064 RepID=A0ABP0CTM7_9PEZI